MMNIRTFFLLLMSCFLAPDVQGMIALQPQEAINFIQYQLRLTHQAPLDFGAVELLQQRLSEGCSSIGFLQGTPEELVVFLQSVYAAHDWWLLLLQQKQEELLPHCAVCKDVCGAVCVLPCGHCSHKSCLLQWYANKPYKRHSKCPVCMVPLGRNCCKSLCRKKQYKALVQKAYSDWCSSEIAEINFMAEELREEDLREIEAADALFAQQLQDEENALAIDQQPSSLSHVFFSRFTSIN